MDTILLEPGLRTQLEEDAAQDARNLNDEPLGVQIDNRKVLRSPWGERQVVDVYLLDVEIGDLRLPREV
jgi:hypothetical protein